jgi:hypothetical protein
MSKSGYPGIDGFLVTRAPLILDVLCLAMIAVLIVLACSIYLAKVRRRFEGHKKIQITLGVVLLVVIVLFEADIRLHGWQDRAAGELNGKAPAAAVTALYIHLCFAVSTVLLWIVTTVLALRRFSVPPLPGPHSQLHAQLGWLSAAGMALTTITGWIFYYVAFMR